MEMSSTTTAQTVKVLCDMLNTCHGLPQQLVSDNEPQFISSDFVDFCKSNAIKHGQVAPASNGLT